MIESTKSQLVVGLIVACTCGLALCAEPNEPKTGVRFEINNKEPKPWKTSQNNRGRGPIEPTHVAVLHVQEPGIRLPRYYNEILHMLETPAGKSLSERQRQFLSASDAVSSLGSREFKYEHHQAVFLYAVSADEAKKMALDFLQVGISRAEAKMQEYETALSESEEAIARAEKELPAKESELESVTVDYEIVKKKTHSISSDSEAARESKETILEMARVLDSLMIEITGIEAKLSAVDRIKSQKKVSTVEGLAKLEEIRSEQTVELAGALARKKAAIDIRKREEEFYGLYRRWISLVNRVDYLKTDIRQVEDNRQNFERLLADPKPDMLPPKLYQDKVTIHPVKTE